MKIKFKCDECGQGYAVDPSAAGKEANCVCGHLITVPRHVAEVEVTQTATSGEVARYERINAQLRNERGVPIFPSKLWGPDEKDVTLRTPQEVANRIFPLQAVSIRGEGIPLEELWSEFLPREKVWPHATPEERRFLSEPRPDPDEARDLVWRLESIWVLVWALGHLPELPWPDAMCDTHKLMSIICPARDDPSFVRNARLRDKREILDMREMTMRLSWAITDAYLNHRQIPANLDWINPSEWVDAAPTMVGRLCQERHLALNWLVRFGDADWDDVDTPT